MFEKLQKRVSKGYFTRRERLSWAPFPSYCLLTELPVAPDWLEDATTRICRYFGGETVSLVAAADEGLIDDGAEPELECLGYNYGSMSLTHSWLSVIGRKGRVVVCLPKKVSIELVEYAYERRAEENFFIFTERGLEISPYRVISDLLYFLTNHEAPVIVEDLVRKYCDENYIEGHSEECHLDAETAFDEFEEAISEGKVLNQNTKFYRIN